MPVQAFPDGNSNLLMWGRQLQPQTTESTWKPTRPKDGDGQTAPMRLSQACPELLGDITVDCPTLLSGTQGQFGLSV